MSEQLSGRAAFDRELSELSRFEASVSSMNSAARAARIQRFHQRRALVSLRHLACSAPAAPEPVEEKQIVIPDKAREHIEAVSQASGVSVDDIKSGKRRFYLPRQVAIYLIRKTTKLSLPQIARCVGLSDHTSAINALRAVDRRIANGTLPFELADLLATIPNQEPRP